MEKQTITKELGEILYSNSDVLEIDNLISVLTKAKRNGATHAYIDFDNDWDGLFDTLEITALEIRMETDEEMNERLKKEAYEIVKIHTREIDAARAEYERLKKLFGDE